MFNNSTSIQAKQEGDNSNEASMVPKYTSTSRQWAGFKNPRIVRVSKAFGGKDRHSKVCTVKGLRDRRIRLSVPTAIQLYDLQDRLGLNQPSKVIDWLIESTKDDIDKLPPLQMLPGDFAQFYPVPATSLISQDLNNSPQVSFSQFLGGTPNSTFVKDVGNRTLLYTKQGIKPDDDANQRKKGKEALVVENNKWTNEEEESNGDGNGGLNFFPILPQYNSSSNYPSGLMFPYNPYYNWEPPSNLSISQFGNQGLVMSSSQTHNSSSSSMAPIPSSASHEFFLCPPAAVTPASPFPPYLNLGDQNHHHHHDPIIRQNNQFHLLSSSSQHLPPNSLMLPLFNQSTYSQGGKAPFSFDAQTKVRSQNNSNI